jgi:hypothetical protein
MKEKPILFSTPMAQALLNTKPNTWPAEPIDPSKPYKWMTRRVITRINGIGPITEFGNSNTPGYKWHFRDKHLRWHDVNDVAPPYNVGDHLWVREKHALDPCKDDSGYIVIYATDGIIPCVKWRSSMFMPRKAARIFLEVKEVRVERLQRISYEDMNAEGFDLDDNEDFNMAEHYQIAGSPIEGGTPERFAFAAFWDRLNARRGYSWSGNPYVYVYGFMRVK